MAITLYGILRARRSLTIQGARKTISGLLGHMSLETTEIYLPAIEESQRDAVKAPDGVMVAALGCESGPKEAILGKRRNITH